MNTSPSFNDWLPLKKLFYYQITNTGYQPHNLGILRLKDAFLKNNFECCETYDTPTSVISGLSNLRRGDVIVMYFSGLGSADKQITLGNLTNGSEINNAICQKIWNGANVTIIFDTLITDLVSAPQNFTINSLVNTNTCLKWPKNVKIIYAGSNNLSYDCLIKSGSFTYQSSWLAKGMLDTLNKYKFNLTHKQLLQGISAFYHGIQKSNLIATNTHTGYWGTSDPIIVQTPDYGEIQMWNTDLASFEIIKNREPMIGCLDLMCLNQIAFSKFLWTPPPQKNPIKKAVLFGVDCWTNGQARYVSATVDGTTFGAPYLKGTRNDALLMYKILTEKCGFLPQNIALLRDQPSKSQAIQAINWLMSNNTPDNQLVFYFSGHGSQTFDKSGDEKDKMDELILFQNGVNGEIMTDDELYDLIIKPNICDLWCFFDSCHSGTMCDPEIRFTATDKLNKFINDSLRNDTIKYNIHIFNATSESTITYDFNPSYLGIKWPSPPTGYEWDYSTNPNFGYMSLSIWNSLQDNATKKLTNSEMLLELRKRYIKSQDEIKCEPTYGTFTDGNENKIFLSM